MCYSANASIGSFLVSLLGCSYLFLRNKPADRLFAVILLGVSLMQIGEYMMHIDQNCKNNLNYYGSVIGLLSHILIQPMFSLIAVLLFSTLKLSSIIKIVWIIMLFSNFSYSVYNWPKKNKLCSKKYKCVDNRGCQLHWPWFDVVSVPMYAILVFIMPIWFSNLNNKLFWTLYAGISPYLLTIFYPKTSSSLWCFGGPALTIALKIFIFK